MTASETALILLALGLPFLGAVLSPIFYRLFGSVAPWLLALLPLFSLLQFLRLVPRVAAGETLTGGYDWIPSLGIRFSFLLDGLSLTFAILVTGIGTMIVLYAGGYMKGHALQARFLSFMFMFMGSMLGVVISDGLLMLFVFWELTSITSFLLIGFDNEREASRRAALQALVVTGGGGLILLAGVLLIQNITGANSLSELFATGNVLRDSPLYLAAFILVLGGAFTKSAQFPFHFWLPNAMEAPTPVSAYLHSATMVKAGVYLLMRLNPVMGDTALWTTVLPLFGGVTLMVGSLLAIRQTDLKQMLAYTTVASLGLMVMMTGMGLPHAIEGAVLYLIAHALFKGGLFMVAGLIDHETGTRDLTRLGGLAKAMPITFAAGLAGAISMGGLPPFVGFLAKEGIYEALATGSVFALIFLVVAIIGNALMFAVGFGVGLKPFVGPKVETPKHAHEGPALMWIGPVALGVTALLAALFSHYFNGHFSGPMASAVAGETVEIHLSLIPHIGIPLALSVLTVIIAIVVYMRLTAARAAADTLFTRLGPGPDTWFDGFVRGLVALSFRVSQRVQPGRLEFYITATFISVAAVLLISLVSFGEMPDLPSIPRNFELGHWVIFALAIIGLLAVINAHNRLTAIVTLGIQGFAVAVLFLLLGAPDLSFTQFMVETLSVVILTLVMTRLNLVPSDHRSMIQKVFDGTIAVACGLGFSLLLMRATEVPFNDALTQFFNSYSKVIAHGHNVVNVIIVDFRGTDTLGEIAVVMITGLAILALIRIRAGRSAEGRQGTDNPVDEETVR
ncbi:putative monovalent cation/H+ antiporter subunit A [Martelella endophytica]|uniref:Monovalent cation/H+ antiporter subunit A n=1 Tax=Martelella endophytica TaxID=1486262 RepID=A0A0D5LTE0_MAREN|nr:putative monovalent cation/H+ antiporter subunit A [Martelella endophytica]AJY47250.1 monovalent cation/H+ antiporter subunit A [Martelella endophytica]